jgi:hypothetical protein
MEPHLTRLVTVGQVEMELAGLYAKLINVLDNIL